MKIKEWALERNINPIVENFVLPYYERDPKWVYMDKEGHVHSYSEEGEVDTLKFVIDANEEYWCDDCCDLHDKMVSHHECIYCGEHIEPGLIEVPGGSMLINGETSYSGKIIVDNKLELGDKHEIEVELLSEDIVAFYGTIYITSMRIIDDNKWEYSFKAMKMERMLNDFV